MSQAVGSEPVDHASGGDPRDAAVSAAAAGRIVHEILWSEALPWWLLFRAAGAAFSPTVILLAALGCLATWAGWSVADRLAIPAPTSPRLVADDEIGRAHV